MWPVALVSRLMVAEAHPGVEVDGTWDAHAKCDRELCSLQRKPRGLRGLHPGHGEWGVVGGGGGKRRALGLV